MVIDLQNQNAPTCDSIQQRSVVHHPVYFLRLDLVPIDFNTDAGFVGNADTTVCVDGVEIIRIPVEEIRAMDEILAAWTHESRFNWLKASWRKGSEHVC